MPLVAINFVVFQLGWLACVLAGSDRVAALTVLAIGWAILIPLFIRIAQQFDGFNRPLPVQV